MTVPWSKSSGRSLWRLTWPPRMRSSAPPGKPREGRTAVEPCIRLDPRRPFLASRMLWVTIAYYFSREYEAAIDAAKSGIRVQPRFSPHLSLARRSARPVRPDCRGQGGPQEGGCNRTGFIRNVCAEARAMDEAPRPRAHPRRPAQGGVGRLSLPHFLRLDNTPSSLNFRQGRRP